MLDELVERGRDIAFHLPRLSVRIAKGVLRTEAHPFEGVAVLLAAFICCPQQISEWLLVLGGMGTLSRRQALRHISHRHSDLRYFAACRLLSWNLCGGIRSGMIF